MMAAFMRKSKFKHVFGKANKKDECYDQIRITKSSWDSTFCSVNPKYVAIITEAAGGGTFAVIPIEKVGRMDRNMPLVAGHKATVLDIQWCPFNDNVIASASEDCTVKVWEIPEGGILETKTSLTEPFADLVQHQRRVGLVVWHPAAENVLLSAGADNKIFIWNVAAEEVLTEIEFPDMILSASFNFNGSKFVCTCKDKITRIVDPRTGKTLVEGKTHEGSKPQQCCYLQNEQVFTTGFSRMSERQYALWKESNLNEPLNLVDLDTSNGVLFIFYDPDLSIVYLCGKGDSTIRYFEITNEDPFVHFLTMFTSSEPQRGIGFMPKRGINLNINEIARFYKLHSSGLCEVIPFTVPRKSELFQDDLYPPTVGDVPGMTAEEWVAGKNTPPSKISLKDGFKEKEKAPRKLTKAPASSSGIKSVAAVSHEPHSSHSDHVPTIQPAARRPSEVSKSDLAPVFSQMEQLTRRVTELESRVKYLESVHKSDDHDSNHSGDN